MFKKLFIYPPFIAFVSATICISLIAYLSLISNEYILWMIPTFGASVVLITALPDSPLARPRNIFFGHLISAPRSYGLDTYGSVPLIQCWE